ncbi:hypothetical protein ACVWWN_005563 [Mycobacterium sp. URHB0021]|jgi:uncharacterized protein DUF222
MSSTASLEVPVVRAGERVEVLFGELSELAGQRNAIDGRIVQIVAELDHDGLCGSTGARSIAALVAWKLGASPAHLPRGYSSAFHDPGFCFGVRRTATRTAG